MSEPISPEEQAIRDHTAFQKRVLIAVALLITIPAGFIGLQYAIDRHIESGNEKEARQRHAECSERHDYDPILDYGNKLTQKDAYYDCLWGAAR